MSPWDVLGIARTNDLREIQKAYARRLREHRPDEDPEGYQRVRSAYDAAVEAARSDQGDARDGAPFAPVRTVEDEGGDAVAIEASRGPYDEAIAHLRRLSELVTQSAPQSDARWQTLLDDEVLLDLQVRPWLSHQVFRLLADHSRDIEGLPVIRSSIRHTRLCARIWLGRR